MKHLKTNQPMTMEILLGLLGGWTPVCDKTDHVVSLTKSGDTIKLEDATQIDPRLFFVEGDMDEHPEIFGVPQVPFLFVNHYKFVVYFDDGRWFPS